MDTFEEKLTGFIKDQRLIEPGARVLLAVSGGGDSMAMLNGLFELARDGRVNCTLFVAHINHQLRGQLADRDEALVIAEAKAKGLGFETVRVDVKHLAAGQSLSIETAARKLRQEALIRIADTFGCTFIATAHHKDDNAETMIHRMIRGTAYRGLAGIWPRRVLGGKNFIRPLLAVSRNEILEYTAKANIPFNQDHTNEDTTITRNFIRHNLLPAMAKDSQEDICDLLFGLSIHARGLAHMLERQLDVIWPRLAAIKSKTAITIDRKLFMHIPEPLKAEVLRKAVTMLGAGEQDLTILHYRKAIEMIETAKPMKMELPGSIRLRAAGATVMVRIGNAPPFQAQASKLEPGGSLRWNGFDISTRLTGAGGQDLEAFIKNKPSGLEWFDYEKITGHLTVRTRKDGDRFVPIGQRAAKKAGKFLTDSRVADKTSFVIEDEEKIIYLAPIRPSELTRVSAATREILEIKVEISRCPEGGQADIQ